MKSVYSTQLNEVKRTGFVSNVWLIDSSRLVYPEKITIEHQDGKITFKNLKHTIPALYFVLGPSNVMITTVESGAIPSLCKNKVIKLNNVENGSTYYLREYLNNNEIEKWFDENGEFVFSNCQGGSIYLKKEINTIDVYLAKNGHIAFDVNNQNSEVNVVFRLSDTYEQALDLILINDENDIKEGDAIIEKVHTGKAIYNPILWAALSKQAIICNSTEMGVMYGAVSFIQNDAVDKTVYHDLYKVQQKSSIEYNQEFFDFLKF